MNFMCCESKNSKFDVKKVEKKAKKIWNEMNEDSIEIKFVTSPMGLILMVAGIGALICISKKIGKMEQKKQAKALAKSMMQDN